MGVSHEIGSPSDIHAQSLTMSDAIGPRLRDGRKRLGQPLADVGRMIRLSVTWLSRVERGQIDVSFNRLMQLVGCYGITIGDLAGETESTAARVADKNHPTIVSVEGPLGGDARAK